MDCSNYNKDIKELVATHLENVPLMDVHYITELVGDYAEVSPLVLAFKKIYKQYYPDESYLNEDEQELLEDLRTPLCIDTVVNQPRIARDLQNEGMMCNFLTQVLMLQPMYQRKVRKALMDTLSFYLFHFSMELFLNRNLSYNYIEEPDEIYLAYDVHPEIQIDDAFVICNQAIRLRYLLWFCRGELKTFERLLRTHSNNNCSEEEWFMYFGPSEAYLPLPNTDDPYNELLYDDDDSELTVWDDNMVSQHSSPELRYLFGTEHGWTSTVHFGNSDEDQEDNLSNFKNLSLK